MKVETIIQSYVDDVARFLPRRIRNDVGLELRSLLTDQLNDRADDAGTEPDAEMTIELLRSFGRPEEVAERYRPPGVVIIEPSAAPGFARIAAIGVFLQWIISGLVFYRAAATQGPGVLEQLGHWWLTYGLGALWWPGFLVCCYGLASAFQRRRSATIEWQPRAGQIDRDRANLLSLTALILGSFIGIVYLLICPAWVLEQLLPESIDSSWAIYASSFRNLWLPIFVGLFVAQILIVIPVVLNGRWSVGTRRADLGLSIAWLVALVACGLTGEMLAQESSDGIARLALLLVGLFVAVDVFIRLRREAARVRIPA